jgi:SAM-dependent methyltransferase
VSAEFDKHAAGYDGGIDNPVKRTLGDADSFIAVKARWLLRREPGLRAGGLRLLDYGCGAGDLMRVLAGLGAHAAFTGCDVSSGMLAEAARRWPARFGTAPALAVQDGARTPFADGQFDIATVSAVLHHVPPAERPAVYSEFGRVLRPGGRLYVFEHNPRNPLVRHVIARTPIDANAILLHPREVRDGLLGSARYELETDYLMFMPPGLGFLRFVDRALAWLPLGAQYAVAARKPA